MIQPEEYIGTAAEHPGFRADGTIHPRGCIKKHRRQWSGIVDRTVADGNAGRNI